MASHLDARARPPIAIRQVYKEYQNIKSAVFNNRPDLIQFDDSSVHHQLQPRLQKCLDMPTDIRNIFHKFLESHNSPSDNEKLPLDWQSNAYQVLDVPGLFVYPKLLPPPVQLSLLDRLLHREVPNPQHQTNIHLHYHVTYPAGRESYFSSSATDIAFEPKDRSVHKPLDLGQFLNRKLRWATLGGQYDWTNKVYPPGSPPAFPPDIKQLVEDMFPMKTEAAILNLYSPGDTLSLHRDVSEECDRPLVSISLGCDSIFVCGLDAENAASEPRLATIRLRSGDALLMSGDSRYAWHGVPKVLEGTCPAWMEDWPASGISTRGEFDQWRGWMKNKRVNLNVRQMFA